MSGGDRRGGIPEPAGSAQVLADQVEDVLGAIRDEIGGDDDDAPLAAMLHPAEPSRPSIPELLAPAIVMAEPSSPVDAWARGGHDGDERDDVREPSKPPWAPAAHPETKVALVEAPSSPGPEEGIDGPSTLRSVVSVPTGAKRKARGSRWLLAGLVVAGAAGIWRFRPPAEAPQRLDAGLGEVAVNVPAVPTTGTIILAVGTEGARLFIDGREVGAAASVRHALPPGKHRLVVKAPGHLPLEREIAIEAGEVLTLEELVLTPERRRLVIEVEPESAYVMISRGGELEGRRYAAPWPRILEVEPGKYTIVAFRQGLKTVLRPVDIPSDREQVAVRIRLGADAPSGDGLPKQPR